MHLCVGSKGGGGRWRRKAGRENVIMRQSCAQRLLESSNFNIFWLKHPWFKLKRSTFVVFKQKLLKVEVMTGDLSPRNNNIAENISFRLQFSSVPQSILASFSFAFVVFNVAIDVHSHYLRATYSGFSRNHYIHVVQHHLIWYWNAI